eukprot:TRINITY_DN7306_c0_g1_i2.p1 TRINITY_DN7306_c0_g1~~TRINITY_DN7306_c0_g1_i2.p1  ORF type:complete len:565 (-),score=109.38 TRINITY_DN7306_c0_g1_i2:9-1703(-)
MEELMSSLFPELTMDHSWGQVIMQTSLYGYVLFIAADFIGGGAELLLLVPSISTLVGSIVLPILGAVPDGMMVLCSGMGPADKVNEQVKVGVGALAGSTIMLLTLPWFLAVHAGRVSVHNGQPTYVKPSTGDKDWSKLMPPGHAGFFDTGVGIGEPIRQNAKIMILTSLSYLVIQGPAFMVDDKEHTREQQFQFEDIWALIGLVTTCSAFCWYLYQMFQDSKSVGGAVQEVIVKSTVDSIQSGQLTLRGAMAQFRDTNWRILGNSGNVEVALLASGAMAEDEVSRMCKLLVPFFRQYDLNGDNKISIEEFRMIMKDLNENVSQPMLQRIFSVADVDRSGYINFEEFVACIMAFALDTKQTVGNSGGQGTKSAVSQDFYLKTDDDEEGEEEDMPEDLADLPPEEQQRRIKKRALYKMTVGTLLVLLFSDPMTNMLSIIGDKLQIDRFYVSFLLAPLASNSSELVSAMRLARPKTVKSMVQALSTLEGAAIMNNTFCLAIFLLLIVWKHLAWQFCAETAAILVIQILVGGIALRKKTQTLADGFVVLACYPFSLFLVWALHKIGLD